MNICSVCQQCYDDSITICAVEDHGSLTPAREGDCQVVEGYRIDSRFESFSPVELFKATHLASEKSVLIRFIAADDDAGDLKEDLQSVAGINHPNLARLFEFGKLADGEFYVVLEDIPGRSLSDHLTESSPLSERQAVRIARQIAEGLEELHAAGVIHRMVNPANIYFTDSENDKFEVKLQNYDFGAIGQRSVVRGANGIDAKTEILRYFSPEQFTDEKVDFRSDIYSLSVVFYEMLLGHPPYTSLNPQAIAKYAFKESEVEKLHFNLRALLAYTLREAFQHRLDMRPPTTNNFVRQLRHIELIATPTGFDVRDELARRSKPKPPVAPVPQTVEPELVEERFAAGEEVPLPEPVVSEISASEFSENETIEPEIEEVRFELKIEEPPADPLDEDKPEQEFAEPEILEAVPVLETVPASEVEDLSLQSVEPENSVFEFYEESVEISEPAEAPEFYETGKIDPVENEAFFDDLIESGDFFEDIHITNKEVEEEPEPDLIPTETDESESPALVEPVFVARHRSRFFESVKYFDEDIFEEPDQKEPAAAGQFMDSFAAYTRTASLPAKKNFIYIAGILLLLAFGGLAAVYILDRPSEAKSSQTAPSPKNRNVSRNKTGEVADMVEKGNDTPENAKDDRIQKISETVVQSPSGKPLPTVSTSKSEKEKATSAEKNDPEKISAQKKAAKTRSEKDRPTVERNEQGKGLEKKSDTKGSKPAVNKTDGNTRPRIVPDGRINPR
ncbi:MAG: serine/threonine-protein kinase [Pyrinomonadaceae bacterium]